MTSSATVECKRCHHRQPYMPLLPGCAVCGTLLADPSAPKKKAPKKKAQRKKKWKANVATKKKAVGKLEDIVMVCSHCGAEKKFFEEDKDGAWIRSLCTPDLQTICAACLKQGKTLVWPEI